MYAPPKRLFELSEDLHLFDPVIDQIELKDFAIGSQIEVSKIETSPGVLRNANGVFIKRDSGVVEEWMHQPPSLQDNDVFVSLKTEEKKNPWIVDTVSLPDAWIAPSCVYDFVRQNFVPTGVWVFGGLYDTINWRNQSCSCGRIYTRVAENLIAISSHKCHDFGATWDFNSHKLILRSPPCVLVAPSGSD